MKQKLLLLLLTAGLLSGCTLGTEKAGIEIMSYPEAKVYIDGKDAGMTPYKNNSLKPEEVEIKLVTDLGEWTKKIRLQNRTSTVIQREFGKEERFSGGYVLNLEPTGDGKKAGLLVSSQPDRSTIKIENEVKGMTPMKWEDIGEGEKQISISYPAHKPVIVYAKGIKGFQLLIDAQLPEEEVVFDQVAPSNVSSPSAELTTGKSLVIKETETGWLRVRGQPNTVSAEVGKVNPGEKYEILDETDGYFEIKMNNGINGWISAKYADKI